MSRHPAGLLRELNLDGFDAMKIGRVIDEQFC